MPKIIFEKIIKADRKRVFEITSNFENFQKIIPQYYPSIRIVSVRGNTSVAEEHLRIAGRELVMMAKHVIDEPISHEIFIIGGDSKGTHITYHYEHIPNGTKLTVEVNWKLKGMLKLGSVFGKNDFTKEYSKIIDEFAIIAEG